MEIDNDILVIQDNRPIEPMEDPLQINQYNMSSNEREIIYMDNINEHNSRNETENVINLDSSDDETQMAKQNFATEKNARSILRASLQQDLAKLPLHSDVIDLDVDDSDALAPLRLFMNHSPSNESNPTLQSTKNTFGKITYTKTSKAVAKSTKKTIGFSNTKKRKIPRKIKSLSNSGIKLADKNLHNIFNSLQTRVETTDNLQPSVNSMDIVSSTTKSSEETNVYTVCATGVPENQNLTYLGKIIRLPGQPSLIENSSGLIFRTDNNLSSSVNAGRENKLETEVNLYRNFLKCSNNIMNNIPPAQDLPNPSHNIFVKDFFIEQSQKTNTNIDAESRQVPDSSDNRLFLQSFTPDNIRKQSKEQLISNHFSGPSVSGKKTRLAMLPPSFKEQHTPMVIPYQPQEPNSTVLDLNLNINDTGSSSATNFVNTISPKPNSLTLPNDLTGRYNLALGLFLNVNDTNQPNNSYKTAPKSQFTSLNNVALDVSFNVNNKEKPATVTSNQVLQKTLSPFTDESTTNRDVIKTYRCGICSFRTFNIELVKSHLCPSFSSLNTVHTLTESIATNKNEGYQTRTLTNPLYNKRGNMYCCNICSFKTFAFELMERHDCAHYPRENSVLNLDQQCAISNGITENSSMEKMYCCVACSFQTADFEVMNSHICPSVNRVLTYSKNPNLEQIKTPAQNFPVETENHQKTRHNVYSCVACSFQTTDMTFMTSHQCFSVIEKKSASAENTTAKKERSIKPKQKTRTQKIATKKLYCCMSCSFKTAIFALVKSHRCRKSNVKDNNIQAPIVQNKENSNTRGLAETQDMQNSLNNLDEVLEKTSFLCEICRRTFKTKYLLFQHLRDIHFGVIKLFTCLLCIAYFDNAQDLTMHFKVKHQSMPLRLHYRDLYQCGACDFRTELLKNMKIHFDKHIETYHSKMKMSLRCDEQSVLQQSNKKFLYECKLCGKETDSITVWLTHVCSEPKEDFIVGGKADLEEYTFHSETVKRTYKCRGTKLSKGLCYYCKRHIFGEALKCDNSECENLYHLLCVEDYGQSRDPAEVNKSDWFCPECNYDILPVQNTLDNINWCLNLADTEYLREVEKQKLMADELQKIKTEKVTIKEEFQRIKTFIMESKSERINNSVVKGVCAIVESFINAGIDCSD